MSASANHISEVQQVKQFESTFTYHILAHVNLQSSSATLQVRKTRLAHQPVGNQTPCNVRLDFVGFQFCCRGLRVLPSQLRRRSRPAKLVRVGGVARRDNLRQLLLPLRKLVPGL